MDVLLDTNLIVLLVVGNTEPHLINSHRRLKEYEPSDYELLLATLSRYSNVIVTPNIMSEASNLLGYINDPAKTAIRHCTKVAVDTFTEKVVLSSVAVAQAEYLWLGLTDAAILACLDDSTALLTADLNLYVAAVTRRRVAINFNHLRDPGER